MGNANTEQNKMAVPRWFKMLNAIILTIVLTGAGYIIINNIGNSHNKTSGAGEIWWVTAPEVDQAYRSIVKKTESKKGAELNNTSF